MSKIVLVNATSLDSGGALTILNQYINDLFIKAEDDEEYYIFVPDTCKINKLRDNIHFIKNSENPFYKSRNYWNSKGLKKWCDYNKIECHELFSMQNYYPFGFLRKKINKRLYLHQPVPFFKYKWSIFKKNERLLWFYKSIYYHLIKRSVKQSNKIIVQTEWLKKQVVKKLNIEGEKVVVERPILNLIDPKKYKPISNLEGRVKLFYPASEVAYKNHDILFKSLDILVNEYNIKDVVLYLTMVNETNKNAQYQIKKYNLQDNVIFTGKINYEQVMRYYKSVDVLVFPSKIETFGLPLIEAQHFDLPIIASDLEIYREVIGEYSGDVVYCGYDDARAWADSIVKIVK